MREEILVAGSGGQGVLLLGKVIAQAAIGDGRFATYYPTYGAEIRGGTANCSVIISAGEIASPVAANPGCMIILNDPSFRKFGRRPGWGGLLVANSSLVRGSPVGAAEIPASDIAQELGDIRCANIVMLGKYIAASGALTPGSAEQALKETFRDKKIALGLNLLALRKGLEHK